MLMPYADCEEGVEEGVEDLEWPEEPEPWCRSRIASSMLPCWLVTSMSPTSPAKSL